MLKYGTFCRFAPTRLHVYHLTRHEVGVVDNILMLGTVHGICTVSGICLSVCLSTRRGRYVMLRIILLIFKSPGLSTRNRKSAPPIQCHY